MNGVFVTFEHLHSFPDWGVWPGFCHRGARALYLRHGLDWPAIVRDGGIAETELAATGDALVLALIGHARLCSPSPLAGEGLEEKTHG